MASKETREKYRGPAVITAVEAEGVEDWKDWEKRDLSEADKSNALKIVYSVAEKNDGAATHEVKVEVSHRELKGKMLDYYRREDGSTPTQIDVAIRMLKGQGLVDKSAKTEADLVSAMDDGLVGREVTIRAYDELGNDGATWWPRCAFASKFQRLTGSDKAARMAAFIAGTPAPKPTATAATSAAPTMPAAPAEDADDLPF